jgi:hypothetical protein
MSSPMSAVSYGEILRSNRKLRSRLRKPTPGASQPKMETLEARLMLFGSSVIGNPYSIANNSWQYEEIAANGTTVNGAVTFNSEGQQSSGSISGFELQTTESGTVNSNTATIITKDFFTNSSAGLQDNGTTTETLLNGVEQSSSVRTFNPDKILLPATLTPGQSYSPGAYTRTTTTTIVGEMPTVTTDTIQQQFVLTTDSPKSLTVLGTQYTVDEVDVTTTDTPTGGSPSTTQEEDFYSPGIGLVESVSGPLSAPTGYIELDHYTVAGGGGNGGTGGGGGSGSTTPSALTPKLTGSLPKSLIAGQAAKIKQTVTLTNSSGATYDGSVTGQFFLSTSDALNSSSIELPESFTKTVDLKAKAHLTVSETLASLPASTAAGTYHLLLEVTDKNSDSSVAASAGAFTLAPPNVALKVTVAKFEASAKTGKSVTETLRVANSGNIAATGSLPIEVFTSPNGQISDATEFTEITKGINIKPGKSVNIPVALSFPTAGSFFLGFDVDPDNTFHSTNVANNLVFSSTELNVS